MPSSTALISQSIVRLEHARDLPPPVFILAPVRSFTSIVSAMIGQHPEMYGLPELHLLPHASVGARLEQGERSPHRSLSHGLNRAVAELYFGEQTEASVILAREWLQTRAGLSTEFLLKLFADRVYPRTLIEKSPSNADRIQSLRRIQAKFPDARYIHLVRHPRGHCESVMKALAARKRKGPLPPNHWLMRVATYRPGATGSSADALLDPQYHWLSRNRTILDFLESVAPEQQLRVLGEDVLSDPDAQLRTIAGWLGVSTDSAAVERMKHPEDSPYAFLGPKGARYGNDDLFLRNPALRGDGPASQSLDGPLGWCDDGRGFTAEVLTLATEFGYA